MDSWVQSSKQNNELKKVKINGFQKGLTGFDNDINDLSKANQINRML